MTTETLLSVFIMVFGLLIIFGRGKPVTFVCAPCAKGNHCKNQHCDCQCRPTRPEPDSSDKKAA